MFSSILKIIPKLDASALRSMERNLQSRFTRVAKTFGRGMVNIFKGGGWLGLAIGVIAKILNPLKEVQEAIDRTLKSSDDIATNAKQFGTTSGKLAKLIALGQATGLEQDGLFMLINKFQTAVAEAEADPTKDTSVRAFVGREDMAQAFFEFIQSLEQMNKNDQLLVQKEVFGEKQTLKMAEFLQQGREGFAKLFAAIGLNKIKTGDLTKNLNYLGDLSDRANILTAKRSVRDIGAKAGVITNGMITARDRREEMLLGQENKKISRYEQMEAISEMMLRMENMLNDLLKLTGDLILWIKPKIENGDDLVTKIKKQSPAYQIYKWIKEK